MSVSNKLKWMRLLDEYRHVHTQLHYTKEMCKEAAPLFQSHYEEFCRRHGIDLNKLNEQNRRRIQEVYGLKTGESEPTPTVKKIDFVLPPSPGALVVFSGDRTQDSPASSAEFSKEEKHIHDIFSRLFKKIASHIHPDKFPSDMAKNEQKRLINLFHQVKLALEERRYFVLIDAAEEMKISLPKNYAQQNKWLKEQIRITRTEQQEEQRTYNYLFSEAETDKEKDNIIRSFMYQLFNLVIP